jgi:hypothetical protein
MSKSFIRFSSLTLVGAAACGYGCQDERLPTRQIGQVELQLATCGSSPDQIKACISVAGILRVITGTQTCLSAEKPLCWNQVGPKGSNSLATVGVLPVGDSNCPTGGSKLAVGLDADGDGKLVGTEIIGFTYVCNGATGPAGANGKNSLTKTTIVAADETGLCTNGGMKVETGLDLNQNGVLDPEEVVTSQTQYVCNGAHGATGGGSEANPLVVVVPPAPPFVCGAPPSVLVVPVTNTGLVPMLLQGIQLSFSDPDKGYFNAEQSGVVDGVTYSLRPCAGGLTTCSVGSESEQCVGPAGSELAPGGTCDVVLRFVPYPASMTGATVSGYLLMSGIPLDGAGIPRVAVGELAQTVEACVDCTTCGCSGSTNCNGQCVDTQCDSANCGGCGVQCPVGQWCANGGCTCGGLQLCNGQCVDTQYDSANCGGCGVQCPVGQWCSGGACVGGGDAGCPGCGGDDAGSAGTGGAGGAATGGAATGGVNTGGPNTGGVGFGGFDFGGSSASTGDASGSLCSSVASLPSMGTACTNAGETLCDASGNRCLCEHGIWFCNTACAAAHPNPPAPNSDCQTGAVCDYPAAGVSCACTDQKWNCFGGSVCPTDMPITGDACGTVVAEVCDYPNSVPFLHYICACPLPGDAGLDATWTCYQSAPCPAAQPPYDLTTTCQGPALCAYGSTQCACVQGSPWFCGLVGIPFPP